MISSTLHRSKPGPRWSRSRVPTVPRRRATLVCQSAWGQPFGRCARARSVRERRVHPRIFAERANSTRSDSSNGYRRAVPRPRGLRTYPAAGLRAISRSTSSLGRRGVRPRRSTRRVECARACNFRRSYRCVSDDPFGANARWIPIEIGTRAPSRARADVDARVFPPWRKKRESMERYHDASRRHSASRNGPRLSRIGRRDDAWCN